MGKIEDLLAFEANDKMGNPDEIAARRAARAAKVKAIREKQRRCYFMHIDGYDWESIAIENGYASQGAACAAAAKYKTRRVKETDPLYKDDIRQECIDKLREIMASSKEPKIKMAAIVNIAKLSGIDVNKVDLTSNGQALVKYITGIDPAAL